MKFRKSILAREIDTYISCSDHRINNLLVGVASQLADGYWENESYYDEFFTFLDFDYDSGTLIVKVKSGPDKYSFTKNIFDEMSDTEVIHYVGMVVEDCYIDHESLYPLVSDDDRFITTFINELKNW